MLVLGHRGVAGLEPENSAAGFARAVEMGLDGVEFDVRPDAGGRPVISHDPDLARLFRQPYRIERLGVRTLKRITGGDLLTLDEALDIVQELELIDIEIKAEDQIPRGVEEQVASIIARRGLRSRVLVTSFNPICLWRVRKAFPPARTGLLLGFESPWWLRHLPMAPVLGCEAVLPGWKLITEPKNLFWRRQGLLRMSWTVNDEQALRIAAENGFDAAISDHPQRIRELLDSGVARALKA